MFDKHLQFHKSEKSLIAAIRRLLISQGYSLFKLNDIQYIY